MSRDPWSDPNRKTERIVLNILIFTVRYDFRRSAARGCVCVWGGERERKTYLRIFVVFTRTMNIVTCTYIPTTYDIFPVFFSPSHYASSFAETKTGNTGPANMVHLRGGAYLCAYNINIPLTRKSRNRRRTLLIILCANYNNNNNNNIPSPVV